MMFANARMYAINPAVAAAWRALLEWVALRAEVDVEVIDYPAPAPLPSLWARPDAACVFMCGYPLSRAQPQPRVLAAPVPSARRYGGKPVYWTDIIVPVGSKITRLEETFGHRFAFTTEIRVGVRRRGSRWRATRGASLLPRPWSARLRRVVAIHLVATPTRAR
jgi:hypothetical protein